MRRIFSLSLLVITLVGGTAMADRHRGGGRGRAKVVVRGGGGVVVRGGGGVVVRDRRHVNRRVVERRAVRVSNGRFVFNGGVSYRYTRPVIRERYYNMRVRPQVVVERYPAQPGYIWVSGSWAWNGGEWVWNGGYYAPDPSISVYYDDGTWE